MDNAQYVVTAWVITGLALGLYAARVVARLRRADRVPRSAPPA